MGDEARTGPAALRAVLASYPGLDPSETAVSIEPLAGGLLHASYAISAPSGEYIAQRVSAVFSPAIHDNIAAVTRHLARRGCPSFSIVETSSGALYREVGEERWRVLERLPGETFETCEGPEQARAAGAVVGDFHSALSDFERPLAPLGIPFHETLEYLEGLRRAITERPDHPRADDVAGLAERIFAAFEQTRPAAGLPLRVLHGDLKFSNVLFRGREGAARREATALIDLDTVARLPIYFDMGDAWRSWSNRKGEDVPEAELDVEIFRAAAEGYFETLSLRLSPAEIEALRGGLEHLALELCARFATDVLRESYFNWDDARFASAAEHNWARARGQWSLFEQALETRTERLSALP